MQQLVDLNALKQFFSDGTAWLHLVFLLFISYLLVLFGTLTHWSTYFQQFLYLSLLYAPCWGFALVRLTLRAKLPGNQFMGLWLLSFLVYPCVLSLVLPLSWTIISPIAAPRILLGTIGLGIVFIEIAIQLNGLVLNWARNQSFFSKLRLERMVLICLILLSIMHGGAATFELIEEIQGSVWEKASQHLLVFISSSSQFFLLGLVYYFFYWINHYWLIPRLLKARGLLYYGFGLIGAILIFYPLLLALVQLLPLVQQLQMTFVRNGVVFAQDGGFLPFSVMLLSLPIIVSKQWFQQHSAITKLEQQRTTAELHSLQQQLNPHFFFNTLNNLYALSISQDKRTPEMILQLADLMRYTVYKGKEEQVSLKEEVRYLKDYIRLQRMRLHQELDVQFDCKLLHPEQPIPPLLFIVLLENAFKHGIEPATQPPFLYISLQQTVNTLTFECINSVEPGPVSTAGIGLENLARRLELQYPNRHHLEIDAQPDLFSVRLTLYL